MDQELEIFHPFAEPEPTRAKPGTEAKIQVMEERYLRREFLFHPDDAHDCGRVIP